MTMEVAGRRQEGSSEEDSVGLCPGGYEEFGLVPRGCTLVQCRGRGNEHGM